MKTIKSIFVIIPAVLIFSTLLLSCEKEVTVKVPAGDEQIVVEGYIETDTFPVVFLSRTLPFFGEINTNDVLQNLIRGAKVIVSDGTITDTLIDAGFFYISPNIRGQVGKTYTLTVLVEGKTLTASTTITQPVPLDSVWFKVDGDRDSLGFAWAKLDDPDTLGNCYRWFAKRINRYTFGPEAGIVKDSIFIPALGGSVFDDKFINGRNFDNAFPRGSLNFSERADDNNDERFLFKKGDTIVVKFCTLDRDHFNFWRSEETQVGNNGNPFGSPQPVNGNIKGGLGIWGAYSPSYDTIFAQ